MDNAEKVYFALDLLLDVSKTLQTTQSCYNGPIEKKQWLKEFCTVKVGTSRRAGHDCAIIRLLQNKFRKAVVISQNAAMSKAIERDYHNSFLGRIEDNAHVFGSIDSALLAGKVCEAIIVNNCESMTKEYIDRIYDFATGFLDDNKIFYVILVH